MLIISLDFLSISFLLVRSIYLLADWMINNSLVGWLIDSMIYFLIDWLI